MVALSSLWLPILVSAILVFVASSIIHMATPWHKSDCLTTPHEDKVMEALRAFAIPPGDYALPHPKDMAEMKSPQFAEKMNKGPVMWFTVRPSGPWSMGPALVLWFIFSIVVGIFTAYVTAHALATGASYPQVFRIAGTIAFVGYALALWPFSIWYGRSWVTTIKGTIDGLIYGLLTAGAFGWLWPR
ncbi:MAG TPA: hypothetical protein VMU79_13815 [Casimicrobiaceae bacterium]|jgi:hypothetical protein|nr:hypothetical protein [Casimicrobiaceae bacterium]